MARDESFVDDLVDRLGSLGEVRARRMFGGHGLWCDDVFFGVVDEGVVYLRVDEMTVEAYRAAGSAPFQPIPDKPPMGGYYELPLGVLEHDGELRAWSARALEAARRHAARKGGKGGKGRRKAGKPARARRDVADAVPVGKLQNLGPKSVAWLREVGIVTRADLERVGSVRAYRKVAEAGLETSLNLLYALEGALLDLRWDRLPEAVKQNLRERAGR